MREYDALYKFTNTIINVKLLNKIKKTSIDKTSFEMLRLDCYCSYETVLPLDLAKYP